jgi:transcriptional regulator with XRE-family HTH domain
VKFSDKLKEIRKKRGLNRSQLAAITKISPAQISRYESGGAKPTLDFLYNLASKLDVNLNYFVNDNEIDYTAVDSIQAYNSGLDSAAMVVTQKIEEYEKKIENGNQLLREYGDQAEIQSALKSKLEIYSKIANEFRGVLDNMTQNTKKS